QGRRQLILAGKLNEQDRVRLATDERVHGGAKSRNVARKADHGAIDELDRARAELDDMAREIHRRVELRKVAHAERALRRNARELEMQALGPSERAFRADEDVRRVGVRRTKVIDVVPSYLAQQLREARFDLFFFPLVQHAQTRDEILV